MDVNTVGTQASGGGGQGPLGVQRGRRNGWTWASKWGSALGAGRILVTHRGDDQIRRCLEEMGPEKGVTKMGRGRTGKNAEWRGVSSWVGKQTDGARDGRPLAEATHRR